MHEFNDVRNRERFCEISLCKIEIVNHGLGNQVLLSVELRANIKESTKKTFVCAFVIEFNIDNWVVRRKLSDIARAYCRIRLSSHHQRKLVCWWCAEAPNSKKETIRKGMSYSEKCAFCLRQAGKKCSWGSWLSSWHSYYGYCKGATLITSRGLNCKFHQLIDELWKL